MMMMMMMTMMMMAKENTLACVCCCPVYLFVLFCFVCLGWRVMKWEGGLENVETGEKMGRKRTEEDGGEEKGMEDWHVTEHDMRD